MLLQCFTDDLTTLSIVFIHTLTRENVVYAALLTVVKRKKILILYERRKVSYIYTALLILYITPRTKNLIYNYDYAKEVGFTFNYPLI